MTVNNKRKTVKYFVASDIHGHGSEFISLLLGNGFVPNDDGQMLVICGDCFDRGSDNKSLFKFLKNVKNKVIIRGNHEDILKNILKRGYITVSDIRNGTDVTVEELCGVGSIDGSTGAVEISDYRRRQIEEYLSQTVDYYETESFVFVHGWIPEPSAVTGDWRNATAYDWGRSRWDSWLQMRDKYWVNKKLIICGHRSSCFASRVDSTRREDDYSPYYGEHFIAIDPLTIVSGVINILVLEDKPLESIVHYMRLDRAFWSKVARGSKTVEMRLFDEKRRKIKAGDRIIFESNDPAGDRIEAEVLGTYVYPSFKALTEDFEPKSLGFAGRSSEQVSDFMNRFYPEESVRKYGTVAIKIKALKETLIVFRGEN